jgi:predicted MFS family arabinose efflux permease
MYLSHFYQRTEMALRIGVFYTATSLSGAFGGLLARGLNAIGYKGGLEGWRWIFIVEGLLTVFIGICSFFILPKSIEAAHFLNAEQKAHGRQRIDDQDNTYEPFSWQEVKRGIFNLQVWLSALAYFTILCGIYSFGLFLPTIINNLKFASDPNEAQLWTVIPYAVAAVCTVLVAVLSDKMALRGPIMLCTLPIAIVGYGVISRSKNPHVQYGMTFMMATGLYSTVPCMLSWNSNNSAGYYKRATTSALQLAIANCGGIVASWVYPKKEAPHFKKSHSIILGLLCMGWLLYVESLFNLSMEIF